MENKPEEQHGKKIDEEATDLVKDVGQGVVKQVAVWTIAGLLTKVLRKLLGSK